MFIMLTKDNYDKGMAVFEQSKYNIAYDRKPLFDIVCANLADRILNTETVVKDLTEEQIEILVSLKNK